MRAKHKKLGISYYCDVNNGRMEKEFIFTHHNRVVCYLKS